MSMERTEVLDMMGDLKLFGMRSAYDETLATALKRNHEPQRFVGDLLKAEISDKQARSIKDQLTVAKLPLAKDADDFAFKDTPINEALVRDLAGGGFLAQQRNLVLVGGTGTGRRTWPSPLREAASAPDRAGASSPLSISSISSRPKVEPAARDASPTT
jgi:DNA replication protein DnaC